jgi:hypothetical protein
VLPPSSRSDLHTISEGANQLELFYAPGNTRGQFAVVEDADLLLGLATNTTVAQATACSREPQGFVLALLPVALAIVMAGLIWGCMRACQSTTSVLPDRHMPLEENPLYGTSKQDGLFSLQPNPAYQSATAGSGSLLTNPAYEAAPAGSGSLLTNPAYNPLFRSSADVVDDLYGTVDDVTDRPEGRLQDYAPACMRCSHALFQLLARRAFTSTRHLTRQKVSVFL